MHLDWSNKEEFGGIAVSIVDENKDETLEEVLTFATLSFLGLGVQEGYVDWGQMLNLARSWLLSLDAYYYIAVYPGAALIFFVLAWSLLGDGLRDVFDPRSNGRR